MNVSSEVLKSQVKRFIKICPKIDYQSFLDYLIECDYKLSEIVKLFNKSNHRKLIEGYAKKEKVVIETELM